MPRIINETHCAGTASANNAGKEVHFQLPMYFQALKTTVGFVYESHLLPFTISKMKSNEKNRTDFQMTNRKVRSFFFSRPDCCWTMTHLELIVCAGANRLLAAVFHIDAPHTNTRTHTSPSRIVRLMHRYKSEENFVISFLNPILCDIKDGDDFQSAE